MKKSTLTIVIVSIVFGVLLLAGTIVGFGYMAVKGGKSNPSTDAEKKLVLSSAAFAQFDQTLDPKCDTYKTTRPFGMTAEIAFEHDCEQSDLYVLSEAKVSLTERDARQNYVLMIGGYRAGLAIAGNDLKIEPRDNLVTFGDQRYGGIIKMGTTDVGNVFVVRQGRVLHTAMITGISYDDPESVRALLGPLIEESKRQYGKKAK